MRAHPTLSWRNKPVHSLVAPALPATSGDLAELGGSGKLAGPRGGGLAGRPGRSFPERRLRARARLSPGSWDLGMRPNACSSLSPSAFGKVTPKEKRRKTAPPPSPGRWPGRWPQSCRVCCRPGLYPAPRSARGLGCRFAQREHEPSSRSRKGDGDLMVTAREADAGISRWPPGGPQMPPAGLMPAPRGGLRQLQMSDQDTGARGDPGLGLRGRAAAALTPPGSLGSEHLCPDVGHTVTLVQGWGLTFMDKS